MLFLSSGLRPFCYPFTGTTFTTIVFALYQFLLRAFRSPLLLTFYFFQVSISSILKYLKSSSSFRKGILTSCIFNGLKSLLKLIATVSVQLFYLSTLVKYRSIIFWHLSLLMRKSDITLRFILCKGYMFYPFWMLCMNTLFLFQHSTISPGCVCTGFCLYSDHDSFVTSLINLCFSSILEMLQIYTCISFLFPFLFGALYF